MKYKIVLRLFWFIGLFSRTGTSQMVKVYSIKSAVCESEEGKTIKNGRAYSYICSRWYNPPNADYTEVE